MMGNLIDKMEYLKENFPKEWRTTRYETEQEASDQQSFFCICGRLATGFHEMNCRKFHNLVDRKTAKKLKKIIEEKRGK